MKRRSFLKLVGISLLPLAGVPMGDKAQAHIQLYDGDEPVSEPLPVEFRFNSEMKVKLEVIDWPFRTNRAVLRAPEVGERSQDFHPLNVAPGDTLDLQWRCSLV